MTQQEHEILIENNKMLKEIIMYLYAYDKDNVFKQFLINLLANKASEGI